MKKWKMNLMRGLAFSSLIKKTLSDCRTVLCILRSLFSLGQDEDEEETNISRKGTHKKEGGEKKQGAFQVRKCSYG